jgi:hypothetical protein
MDRYVWNRQELEIAVNLEKKSYKGKDGGSPRREKKDPYLLLENWCVVYDQ